MMKREHEQISGSNVSDMKNQHERKLQSLRDEFDSKHNVLTSKHREENEKLRAEYVHDLVKR